MNAEIITTGMADVNIGAMIILFAGISLLSWILSIVWYVKDKKHKRMEFLGMTYSNRLKSVVSSRLSDSILNPDNRKVYKGIIPYNTALTGRR